MKNKLFQAYWFFLRKPIEALSVFWNGVDSSWNPSGLIQRRVGLGDDGLYMNLSALIPQMERQIEAAKKFGKIRVVIWGDSNGRAWHQYSVMSSFKYIAINLAKGGSTVQELADLFRNSEFKSRVLSKIPGDCLHIFNTGGNCALRGHMYRIVSSYQTLRRAVKKSVLILIPPIHYWLLDPDGQNKLRKKVEVVNVSGARVFENYAYNPAIITDMNRDNIPDPSALIDAVHYSNASLAWLKKCIDVIVKNYGWL